jgi:hypothetical protein
VLVESPGWPLAWLGQSPVPALLLLLAAGTLLPVAGAVLSAAPARARRAAARSDR